MRIEYEDKDLLVIYKEAGLPVQTGRTSQKDLVSILKNHLARKAQEQASDSQQKQTSSDASGRGHTAGSPAGKKPLAATGQPYLGVVHRLDQPVEGLLVFAKTPKCAAALSRQAASKDGMEKVYQAMVSLDGTSYPMAIEGMKKEVMLVDWLGRDTSSNTAYIASEREAGAKRAELVFHTLQIKDAKALLEIQLHTGRHHQIRIQMANASMPLVGDRKYGKQEASGPLCLCAYRLSFVHPVSKKKMQFSVTPSFPG